MALKIKDRINLSRYIFITTISFVLGLCFWPHYSLFIALVFIASILNHFFLFKIFSKFFEESSVSHKSHGFKIGFIVMFKSLLLLLVFYGGVHFIQDGVIIGIIFYLIQIVTLILSLKNRSSVKEV